ncbi:HAMP domain-containing histidine kinase, partial [Candidatus Sumerlaeota bacterium]|nr:HAMP domain-containing histidine kinase [Candidatus Sumerlaeota bacterium]
EDGWLVVKIADTGPGIEPAHLARLFEPFFSTRQDEGGSGLGLYISRGIVEDLGGTIRVSSQAGKGAAFEIALPIANQECVAERR